ncbi:MAG: peptide ABC transporter substrate-binding protein [Fusobacteriaceae bacterium]
MKKKFILVMSLSFLVFFSCGKTSKTEKDTLVFNLGNDQLIDPLRPESLYLINNAFEGLFTEDENGKIVLGSAESMEISKDGLTYTFKIKQNAKWSDGKDLVAEDFKYAWLRGVDPKNPVGYAYMFFYIKNAENYSLGKVQAKDVGIKVIDSKTLQVKLESPVTYFVNLLAFTVYYPVRKDVVEGNPDWATKSETYISNGPFKLISWAQKEELVFAKNENYWDASNVKLQKLVFKIIPDDRTSLSSFKNGEIDIIASIPATEIPNMLKDGSAKQYPALGTNYFIINTIGKNISDPEVAKFLGNKKVRQALSIVIDRESIVKNITKGGQLPATSFVAKGTLDSAGKLFLTKEYYSPKGNPAEAKKLLAEAGYSDPKKIPTISYSFADEGFDKMVAQAIQDIWKKELGVNMELKLSERSVYWEDRRALKHEIGARWWSADYNDPMTFLDLFASDLRKTTETGFYNKEYNDLIRKSKGEQNPVKRTAMLTKAEGILMDNMPIIPIFFQANVFAANPKVKGWYVTPLGWVYFKYAEKE